MELVLCDPMSILVFFFFPYIILFFQYIYPTIRFQVLTNFGSFSFGLFGFLDLWFKTHSFSFQNKINNLICFFFCFDCIQYFSFSARFQFFRRKILLLFYTMY